MATKKVKKFGRGGDILTGLGAGLAGYGIYKELTKGKGDDKDDDYTRRVKEYGRKGDFPDTQKHEKAASKKDEPVAEAKKDEPVAETKEEAKAAPAKDRNAEFANLYQGLTTRPKAVAPAVRKAPVKKESAKKEPAKDRNAEFANLYQGITAAPKEAAPAAADTRLKPADVSGVGSNVLSSPAQRRKEAAAREQAAKDRLAKFEEKRRESKEREARRTQAQNKAKSGTSLRAPGSSMNLNDPYSMTLGSEFDPKRVVRENRSRMPGDKLEYKKGGKVKKYASGGSVKRSASSRADGIAIRGKTRA